MLDHITNFVTQHIVLSGIGIMAIINLLQRVVNDKFQQKYIGMLTDWITKIVDLAGITFIGVGASASLILGKKIGKKAWESIENWAEHSLGIWVFAIHDKLKEKYPDGVLVFLYRSLFKGANSDNGVK